LRTVATHVLSLRGCSKYVAQQQQSSVADAGNRCCGYKLWCWIPSRLLLLNAVVTGSGVSLARH